MRTNCGMRLRSLVPNMHRCEATRAKLHVGRQTDDWLRRLTSKVMTVVTRWALIRFDRWPFRAIGILRLLTYRLLHRRRHGGPATLTASGNLHAFPSVRVRDNPRHSTSRTPIRVDDGSGTGVFASAEGKRMGIKVMKASRRRPTGADNFHFENGKTKTSQPREKKCCILFPFIRTCVFTIPRPYLITS